MNRIDRLNAILIQLQSKRIVKAQEIADRFEISVRTVYRDIRALEEAGVPVGAEAGVGYFLLDSYHLPPVMFTSDEASALLFGEKLVEQMSDQKVKNDFCSALFKIKAILKPSEKDHLEKLHERITVFNYNNMDSRYQRLFLSEIQQALANKQVLKIKYVSKFANEAQCRLVEPIGLSNYGSRWHLIAWCRLREAYRDFRLDRIEELVSANEFFKGKQHLSMKEYMSSIQPGNNDSNIVVLIQKSRLRFVEETKYWYGFISDEDLGENLRMHFANDDLRGFAIWLLNTGSMAKIEKPTELRTILAQFVNDMFDNYSELLTEKTLE
jgi:predicted DNA-binding transcriptional regulator YafY